MDDLEIKSDLSSSEESEEGKHEELVVEEVVEGIRRPQYQSRDLEQLVCFVRDITFLFDLNDNDWNSECVAVIEKWFQEIHHPILFIFFDENILRASLTVPLVPFFDATYFIRDPNEVFEVDTFHDRVQFGTIQEDIDGTLLTLLETIYAPYFFSKTDWSDRVKFVMLESLDNFLTTVTDLYYKMSGLTILPIPCRGLNVPMDDEFTMKRYEKVVIFWMDQIRTFLGDNQQSLKTVDSPSDDYDFWVYREEVLHGLIIQFDQLEVQKILQCLESKQSVYVKQFNQLFQECVQEVVKAKDNIKFLSLLVNPCKDLESCELPSNIPAILPNIIKLILVIWRNSQFLCNSEQITRIFRALSNQIIMFCRSKINLQKILTGFPKEGIEISSMSIDCCIAYREIYYWIKQKVIDQIEWDLDEKVIFNHVETFIERLYDLITICESMVVFGRYDETKTIPSPCFGGTQGKVFRSTCIGMEKMFNDGLDVIKENKTRILNVLDEKWKDVICEFKDLLKDLDEVFQNLLRNVNLNIRNVDDALDVLCTLINFSNRTSLAQSYTDQVQECYNMLIKEIHATNTFILDHKTKNNKFSFCEKYSGQVLLLKINLNRLVRMKSVIQSAYWMSMDLPVEIVDNMDIFEQNLKSEIDSLFDIWQTKIKENMITCLQRSLMQRSISHPGLLECNIDRNLVILFQEANLFRNLGFVIPIHIAQLYQKCSAINFMFESVVTIAIDYNKIVMALSDKERLLFRPMIKMCDKKITKGIYKLNWAGELTDNYISECLTLTIQIQEFMNVYKFANQHIVEICEAICTQSILDLATKDILELDLIKENLDEFKLKSCEKITNLYKKILEEIIVVNEGFLAHREDGQLDEEWCEYVKKIDELLERAFCQCGQQSLKNILTKLKGNGSIGPAPFLQIFIDLETQKLTFKPRIQTLSSFFAQIFSDLIAVFKFFKRLRIHLRISTKTRGNLETFYEVVKNDIKCREYHREILKEINATETELNSYLKCWEPFRSQWTIEKEVFMENFNRTEPNPEMFHEIFSKYTEIANQVSVQETSLTIRFLSLNASNLKMAVIKHIDDWQNLAKDLLTNRSITKIERIYEYIREMADGINIQPTDAESMRKLLATHESIVTNMPTMKTRFKEVRNHFRTMDANNVEIQQQYQKMLKNMDGEWQTFLENFKDAAEILQTSKDQFG